MITNTYTNTTNHPQIIRRPDVLAMTGLSKSTLYNRNQEGSFPALFSLGGRSVGFVKSECELTVQAMIAGYTNDQLKELVKNLVANRSINFGEL